MKERLFSTSKKFHHSKAILPMGHVGTGYSKEVTFFVKTIKKDALAVFNTLRRLPGFKHSPRKDYFVKEISEEEYQSLRA